MSPYPDGMPEWARLTEAELRGEDPRPAVRAMMTKFRIRLRRKTIALTNAAPDVLPNCRCVVK
jgi:hypothetical protein